MSEHRLHIIVNGSLKMSPGKVMAQVAHASSRVTERMIKSARQEWEAYTRSGSAKIVHRATEEELQQLLDIYRTHSTIWCEPIYDAGRNQVDAGSLTAIGFRPLRESDVPSLIKSLKLF